MVDIEKHESVETVLDTHSVLVLSTLYNDRPHAVSLIYAADGLSLYWLSAPDSRHSLALEASPVASVAIAGQYVDFREICGLQMFGNARRVRSKGEIERGLACLSIRYPFLKRFRSGSARLMRHFETASVYRFTPTEITLIDNRVEFGFKQTLYPTVADE